MDLTQWIDKGGLVAVIGLLLYLLKRADDARDAERRLTVETMKERAEDAMAMKSSVDRNTTAIETLTNALANRH